MKRYIATFHTHYAALKTCRTMLSAKVPAEMCPVPRALSADCGTCVRFDADSPCETMLHSDYDQVVEALETGEYRTVIRNVQA